MTPVPLSVLDLVPVVSGQTPADALRNTIDLARRAEEFGYRRHWFAEHHLNPGVAGVSPAVVIALVAGATGRIRLGSGGVQSGHRTALSIVEEFGLLDAAFPGRIDLGVGRSGGRGHRPSGPSRPATTGHGVHRRSVDGLLIPPAFDFSPLLASPRFAAQAALLQQAGAESPDYAELIDDILALLRGEYRTADGAEIHALPGEGAAVPVWILGSSAGQSATVAGKHGLPFAANYHVAPATVLEAVDAYRAAFRPSAAHREPYVIVSADAVAAPDDATARELAAGYGAWVRSIRTGQGAIPYPAPEEAAAIAWTDADRALVADRVDTRFVGTPAAVADSLATLAAATGADELLVTTITHSHTDRVRSYRLLAEEWAGRA